MYHELYQHAMACVRTRALLHAFNALKKVWARYASLND